MLAAGQFLTLRVRVEGRVELVSAEEADANLRALLLRAPGLDSGGTAGVIATYAMVQPPR
mgnify:CR=1 FL=1